MRKLVLSENGEWTVKGRVTPGLIQLPGWMSIQLREPQPLQRMAPGLAPVGRDGSHDMSIPIE
jgi:hypothetical protein